MPSWRSHLPENVLSGPAAPNEPSVPGDLEQAALIGETESSCDFQSEVLKWEVGTPKNIEKQIYTSTPQKSVLSGFDWSVIEEVDSDQELGSGKKTSKVGIASKKQAV